MTDTERRLVDLIHVMCGVIEEMGCTCPDDNEQRNKFHCAPGRRRKDSACQGVAYAVGFDQKCRRILKRGARKEREQARVEILD